MPTKDILAEIAATGRLSAEHALATRRVVYQDGAINPVELDAIFALDEAARDRAPEWASFFVEAVTDYVVVQAEPRGYVSEENARWLKERIAKDGIVSTASELEALVNVIDKAEMSPDWLSAFALAQVKEAVIHGTGPIARGNLEKGRVNAEEAALIRRVLYAFGGGGNIAVTRAEAEVLFDINDATADAENDPAWTDLFVKALANTLMAASGYTPPSREVALKREEWLDAEPNGVGDFIARMASGGLKGVLHAYRKSSVEERWAERNARFEAESKASEVVDAAEAEWLAGRIGRDGKAHANEKALLKYIAAESPDIHPSLRPLIADAA
jgi:hypothetical protein